MNELEIRGGSDDLIELDGAISDEWNAYNAGLMHIAVDGGALLSIEYSNDGLWRIHVLDDGGMQVHKVEATDAEFENSDHVTLTSEHPIKWAVLSKKIAR